MKTIKKGMSTIELAMETSKRRAEIKADKTSHKEKSSLYSIEMFNPKNVALYVENNINKITKNLISFHKK